MRIILWASFLAAAAPTPSPAGESGVEALPLHGPDVELPDAGRSPMRVQVQLVWDGVADKLERRRYEFADPFPAQYDVHYLPLDPSADRPGRISGKGIMTWRTRSDVRFGGNTIMAQYRGDFANGRFEGQGALLMRGGWRYDGGWRNGLMEGHGQLLTPSGDVYTGDFMAGKQHGQGQYISATGEVYQGGFAAGLRDGKGTVTEPGRNYIYSSVWRSGREEIKLRQTPPGRLDLAQSTDSTPDLAVSLSALASDAFCCHGTKPVLGYVSTSYPDRLKIFPDAPQMLDIWRGNRNIVVQDAYSFNLERMGYSFRNYVSESIVPVGLQLGIENLGTATANIVGAYLDVSRSEIDGEPALQSIELNPMSPQNLSFSIENYGWATAEKAHLSFVYTNPKSGEKSERFRIPIGDIKSVHEFSFLETMKKMGADARKLPNWAEACINAKNDGTETRCLRELKDSGSLGRLFRFVIPKEDNFGFQAEGTLDYTWRNENNSPISASVPFSAFVPLGLFASRGECEGEDDQVNPDDENDETAPLRKPFELKIGQENYRVPLPIKSNVNQGVLKRWGIKLNAAKSSRHRFTIVFELADGRLARSRPVDLEFFRAQTFPDEIRPIEGPC